MWTCPACGREFKRRNQSHYCGKAPQTVEEYITSQPEPLRPVLQELRGILNEALPDAQERISWSMPTWRGEQNILHFAVSSRCINLYVGREAVLQFADRLSGCTADGSAIRLDPQKPLPGELIQEIAQWCREAQGLRNPQDGL